MVYLVLINNTTLREITKSTVTCLFDFAQSGYLEGENDRLGAAMREWHLTVQTQSSPEGRSLWM